MRKYLCPTPKSDCTGSNCMVTSGMGGNMKVHITPQEAFKCYRNHLIKMGYKQIGSKEFQRGDEPVLVLNRPGKFGGVMRKGKSGEGGKNRICPKRHSSNVSGTIF